MARLCIKSFLDHGHRFQLFCYKEYDYLPIGVIVRDAREILPEKEIFRDTSRNSLAPFADWFRMKFLSEEGGFWVDMDVVCLSHDVPTDEVWTCRQNDSDVAVGAMRFPAHHPVPTALARLADDPAASVPWDSPADALAKAELQCRMPDVRERRRRIPWGFCGPFGITRALKHFNLYEQSSPPSQMYPVPWGHWRDLYNGTTQFESDAMNQAWSVHLWGEMLRYSPEMWDKRTENSVVSQLMARHMSHPSNAAPEQKARVSILVGICSCLKAGERRKTCRETWLQHPQPGIECRFFIGGGEPLPEEPDVVALDVDDSYAYLPAKGLAFYKWALDNYDFDWLFKCDDDTYVMLERLASLCDPQYDLIGDMSVARRGAPSGGAGYFMSRRLVEYFVAHAEEIRKTGCEDLVFGYLARDTGAKMLATERLQMGNYPIPQSDNDIVSCHWCSMVRLRDIENLLQGRCVSTCRAEHPFWQDGINFFPNGRFMRQHSACSGEFLVEEDGSLTLKWDSWPEERLASLKDGGYANDKGFHLSVAEPIALKNITPVPIP